MDIEGEREGRKQGGREAEMDGYGGRESYGGREAGMDGWIWREGGREGWADSCVDNEKLKYILNDDFK